MSDGGRTGEAARAREESRGKAAPKKKFYRARAHSNPLNAGNLDATITPDDFDQRLPQMFLNPKEGARVDMVDVGCGFGGLVIGLGKLYPDNLVLGLEIRAKVCEFVQERVRTERRQSNGKICANAFAIRVNAMKCLPNLFRKGQLKKMFFLFPDPHFKVSNHRRRVITVKLLDEYAYLLKVGGIIYTITDVEELGAWMHEHLEAHPLFERLTDEELDRDPAARLLETGTEEGQKVKRNGGTNHRHVYRRIDFSESE
eukprot:scaffold338_cov361-Pavlova_lutheri.AAC.15